MPEPYVHAGELGVEGMNTQYEEESRTERITDILVAIVGLGPKVLVLLWVLLAGGVPVALQGNAANKTAEVPVAQATAENTVAAPAEAPATLAPTAVATVEMLELVPAVPAPSVEDAGVLAPGDFSIDPAALGLAWGAQQVAGTAVDPSNRQPGLPPHLLVDFGDNGSGAAADSINLNRPQLRILPIAAYLDMMSAAGSSDAAAAFDSLKALLAEQPTGSDVTIPVPPVLGALQQLPASRIAYLPFNGGQAVGYVTRLADALGPIANDQGLDYVVQGLTDDGRHYVVGLWPLAANFLPDTVADMSADTLGSIQSDVQAYLTSVGAQAEKAADSDFTPDLSNLRRALGSITIGAGVAAKLNAAPAASTVAADPLVGTVWQWAAFEDSAGENDITVDNPENYQIVLWPDGTYSIKADCNVGGGSFVLDGAGLTINPGMTTLAFCGEESLDHQFTQRLFSTATYVFDGDGNLVLNLMADAGNMVFAGGGSAELADAGDAEDQTAATEAGLTSNAYQWTSITAADGTVTTVPNPENYQVILNSDGTFNFQADCNVGSGTYVYNEDGSITFLVGPITRAMCGPDSLDQQFLAALNGTTSFTVNDDGTVTANLADGQTATLLDAGPVGTDGEMADISMGAGDAIIGTVWQWSRFDDSAELNNIVVPNPEDYTLTLWPDGAFSIKADCNVGTGDYTLDGPSLSLVVGPTTRAFCGEESLSDTYIGRLGQTVSYVIDDNGDLNLNLFADAGNMVFSPAGQAELGDSAAAVDQPGAADAGLTGQAFTWQGFTDENGNPVVIENPEDYYLALLPDGTFNIKADCNVGSGTYTYGDDGSITFDLGPLTRALCPPDSHSDAFLTFVNGINSVTVDPDGTVMATTADGSQGTFQPAGPVEVPQVTVPETGATSQPTPQIQPTGPANPLENTTWQWVNFRDAKQDYSVAGSENYTITFLPDGAATIQADCNNVNAGYTVDGSSVNISILAATVPSCGESSLGGVFIDYLNQAATYTIDGTTMRIDLFADGGTMTFVQVP